jgi:acetyl-CoA acyltransferase
VLHAGNSSQISDGAAALLVTTPERLPVALAALVRYHTGTLVGTDPVLMLTGPIPATEKLLSRSGVGLSEIGVFEVNEAFAPVRWPGRPRPVPIRSGSTRSAAPIALGHPLGATGAVLMTRMIHHMRDHGLRYGLQTMCEGGGTSNATLVELVS